MTITDASLAQAARVIQIDRARFHDLLVQTLPSLRQPSLALTRNRADADDLLQAAVTNALAAQSSFIPDTNFRAWMTRILRNRFFSDIRARRETVALDEAPESGLARSGGQEDNLAMQELRRHLGRLPADHRLALMMVTVQGLSYGEVSASLGVPVGTLKCRVFRARKQLRTWLLGEKTAQAALRKSVMRPTAAAPHARPRTVG